MKKMIVVLIILMLTMPFGVFADPSGWAVDLVEASIQENFVPSELQSDYQKNITRYEYVLLALEVLEKNGVVVTISNANPFTDISGHPYESQIIKAYNANIVGGYDDKTFRPDQEIKREEIAALIYNLVKKVNDSTALITSDVVYSDSGTISGWAKNYINFVYNKGIMSGTGKQNGLDTMSPLGKATREQAIVLIYKMAQNHNLLHQPYTAIDAIGEDGAVSGEDVFKTAQKVGFPAMDAGLKLVNDSEASFLFVGNGAYTILYSDQSALEVVDSKYDKDVILKLKALDNTTAINDYIFVLDVVFENNNFKTIYANMISGFKDSSDYVLNQTLSSGDVVSAYSEEDNGELYYFVKYKRNK